MGRAAAHRPSPDRGTSRGGFGASGGGLPHPILGRLIPRLWVAAALLGGAILAPAATLAQSAPRGHLAQIGDEETAPIGVRVAFSSDADERLGGVRVRRLLKIELEGTAKVEPVATGSLSGDLIRVWIHAPNARRAIIEVRRNGRPLARRTLAIASFPSDVAARVVAIEASEMVRVQARALQKPAVIPSPPGARPPGTEQSSLVLDGGLGAIFAPDSDPAAFLGPELALSHRFSFTAQRLFGRWYASLEEPAVRWVEVGAAFELRFVLHERWRLATGLEASVVSLGFPDSTRVFGEPADDGLSIRVGGSVAIETRLSPSLWLALAAEPGALVRPVDYQLAPVEAGRLGGFLFGTALALGYELGAPLFEPPSAPP